MSEIKVRTYTELKNELQELAKKDKRSLNNLIEIILESYVKEKKELSK